MTLTALLYAFFGVSWLLGAMCIMRQRKLLDAAKTKITQAPKPYNPNTVGNVGTYRTASPPVTDDQSDPLRIEKPQVTRLAPTEFKTDCNKCGCEFRYSSKHLEGSKQYPTVCCPSCAQQVCHFWYLNEHKNE